MNRRRHVYHWRRRFVLIYGVGLLLCIAVLRQYTLGPQPFWSIVFAGSDLWHLYLIICGGLVRFGIGRRLQRRSHARMRRRRHIHH